MLQRRRHIEPEGIGLRVKNVAVLLEGCNGHPVERQQHKDQEEQCGQIEPQQTLHESLKLRRVHSSVPFRMKCNCTMTVTTSTGKRKRAMAAPSPTLDPPTPV